MLCSRTQLRSIYAPFTYRNRSVRLNDITVTVFILPYAYLMLGWMFCNTSSRGRLSESKVTIHCRPAEIQFPSYLFCTNSHSLFSKSFAIFPNFFSFVSCVSLQRLHPSNTAAHEGPQNKRLCRPQQLHKIFC